MASNTTSWLQPLDEPRNVPSTLEQPGSLRATKKGKKALEAARAEGTAAWMTFKHHERWVGSTRAAYDYANKIRDSGLCEQVGQEDGAYAIAMDYEADMKDIDKGTFEQHVENIRQVTEDLLVRHCGITNLEKDVRFIYAQSDGMKGEPGKRKEIFSRRMIWIIYGKALKGRDAQRRFLEHVQAQSGDAGTFLDINGTSDKNRHVRLLWEAKTKEEKPRPMLPAGSYRAKLEAQDRNPDVLPDYETWKSTLISVPWGPTTAWIDPPQLPVRNLPKSKSKSKFKQKQKQKQTATESDSDRWIECPSAISAVQALLNQVEDDAPVWTASVRTALLANIVALPFSPEPCTNALVDHVMEAPLERLDLAVRWLYKEAVNADAERLGLKVDQELDVARVLERENVSCPTVDRGVARLTEALCARARSDPTVRPLVVALLTAVPNVPTSALDALDAACERVETVALGLATFRELVFRRPACRNACMERLLQYTKHKSKMLRRQAIRMVVKDVCPHSAELGEMVLDHAQVLLEELVIVDEVLEGNAEKDEDQKKEGETMSVDEVGSHLILYFTLCARDNTLLRGLAEMYPQWKSGVQRVALRQMSDLIRAVGATSKPLLELIADPPQGSENMILKALHVLTDNKIPPAPLVALVRQRYEETKDARLLVPILDVLSKKEIVDALPAFITGSGELRVLGAVVHRLANAQPPPLSLVELVVALHQLDIQYVPLRQQMAALGVCFGNPKVFHADVLGPALMELIEVHPLPPLLLRTVVQAQAGLPPMTPTVVQILVELIDKKIWEIPQLWEGWMLCARGAAPESFRAIMELPKEPMQALFAKFADVKESLLKRIEADQVLPNAVMREVLGVKKREVGKRIAVVNTEEEERGSKKVKLG